MFGSYVRDKDWPGHNLSITTIIGDQGEVLARHWKARNIKGVFQAGDRSIELMTTTIYNVLDEYVEMYGQDEVILGYPHQVRQHLHDRGAAPSPS